MSADILTQIVVREKEDIEKKKLSETHIELGGRGTEFTSDSGNCGGLNFCALYSRLRDFPFPIFLGPQEYTGLH